MSRHNRRIHRHRVFAQAAERGKSRVGWFYDFKLHLLVNDEGELLACCLTPGNTDARAPLLLLVYCGLVTFLGAGGSGVVRTFFNVYLDNV
jgi:hypothetical protein